MIYFVVVFVFLIVYVQVANSFSFFVGEKMYHLFKKLDPDYVFIVLIIHHICQAVLTLLVIVVLTKVLDVDFRIFGLNFNNVRYALKTVLIYIMIWIIIQVGVGILLITVYGISPSFPFPLNTTNFIGYFLFEILLSGTSEEIMFRSLVITVMVYLWGNLFKNEHQLCILVILGSTVIFMIAHINVTLTPFHITHFNTLQQLTCLVSGLFYGFLFIKTKSIVGCMIGHNLLNGVIVITQLVFFITFR